MEQVHTETHGTIRGRIRGFDGLRAIAATLVLAFHLVPSSSAIGYIGVDIFFVLSGFLITALLIKEFERTGRVSIRSFWVRRIRRLLPAVVVTTLGATALARIFGGDALVQLGWQTLGAITGTYNWFEVANSSSYFEHQSPLLLTNMWSLAVEQQFYIVWPPIMLALLIWLPAKVRPYVALALATVSVTAHALIVGADPTRAYVGTDTHAFGLMLGAALALSLPGLLSRGRRGANPIWGVVSWIALTALIALAFVVPNGAHMYPWGMLLAALLTVGVIRGLLSDVGGVASRSLKRVLDLPPLVWLGHRSYGIYLWHWPLWVLAFYHSPLPAGWNAVLIVALSILLADLSFRYVETPIREQGFLRWLGSRWAGKSAHRRLAGALAFASVFALSGVAIVTDKPMSSAQQYIEDARHEAEELQHKHEVEPDTSRIGMKGITLAPAFKAHVEKLKPPPPPVTGANVTIIGDSVTLASQSALLDLLPGAIVDAEVSRSIYVFNDIARGYEANGDLRHYVVIALGTNGNLPDEQINQAMDLLGDDRQVVFVTVSAPNAPWTAESNATIAQLADRYPDQVRVADWKSIAEAHPDLLAGDKIHPGAEGAKLYAAEVVRALESFAQRRSAES